MRHAFPRPASLAAALARRLLFAAALLPLGWAGAAEQPAPGAGSSPSKWYAFSSGNMQVEPSAERAPDGAADPQRITFTPTEKLPGDYWVGAGAEFADEHRNLIEFHIRKTTAQQRTVTMLIKDHKGHQGFYELWIPNDWIKVRLRREWPMHTNGGPAPTGIARIEFILNNQWHKPGEPWSIDVAGMTTSLVKPLPWQDRFWMPATTPPPVPGYRVEIAIHNVFHGGSTYPGLHLPHGREMARDITMNLGRTFGQVGIEIGYLKGQDGADFAAFLHGRGDLSAVTAHNVAAYGQHDDGKPLSEAEQHDLRARNAEGKMPTDYAFDHTHSEDITNPRFLKLARQLYLDSAKAGADVFRPVDYVWPFVNGGQSWCYSASALKAWPADLEEQDVGLELGRGIDPKVTTGRRVAHFWEYFASYHGYRMQPADVGIAAWSEYRPPAPGTPDSPALRNSRTVLNMLYHYEWLKFANEVARPSAEQYGMTTQPVCNPEEINNGTDLYWLSRLAFARGYWTEWWGSAGIIVPTYYNGRYYDNVARTNGKEIVIGGEVSAAGGNPYEGRPCYWDNVAAYLIAYAQAGSVDAKAQNEQYWAWTWDRAIDPSRPEYLAWTATRSTFCGFLQNRNDKALKPRSDVLALTTRSVAYPTAYFDHGSQQAYNLGQQLVELNYLHDGGAFPLEDAFTLDDYRTVLLSTFTPPQGFAKQVAGWLAGKAGRTLVTHSFVPTRHAAPMTTLVDDTVAWLQPGGQEKQFGFGTIADTTVASGVLRAKHPAFAAALKAWDGKEVVFSRPVCRASGVTKEKVLLALGDTPLVTEHASGKGRVIYLAFYPNEASVVRGALQRAIVDAVMRYVGQTPAAIMPPGQSAIAFDKPDGGRLVITFNHEARSDLADGDRVWRTFQARDPAVTGTARLRVSKARTAYAITDLITAQRTRAVSDADGYITVPIDGWNMRGVLLEEVQDRN